MADIRINALPTTATDFASDDYIAIDGTTNGTRKLNAKTANLTFSDVTLGTSGPSVKSSLSARAPRQGLVFDGTAGATISVPALGTGDFTVAAIYNLSSVSGYQRIIGGAANALYFGVKNTNPVVAIEGAAEHLTSTATLSAGKQYSVIYVRSSGTGTFYVDGIAAGSGADTKNYTTQETRFISASEPAKTVLSPLIYNRALSASEVVSLYEAGVPSGADYNSASNTALNTGSWYNANWPYTSYTGVSSTGFTAVMSTGNVGIAEIVPTPVTGATGQRIRVTVSATLTSGATPSLRLFDASYNTVSNVVSLTAGSNTVELVATAPFTKIGFYTSGATSYAVSGISVVRTGLLLAPDAAQAGGGLTWYDTSGNAANITLPASGVSWNVPSSLKLGGNWTVAGRLSTTGNAPITWPANGTATASVVIGDQSLSSTAGVWINTPNNNPAYPCGLGVDGTYSEPNATVNLKAYGVNAGGGYGSSLAFFTSNNTTLSEVGRFTKAGNLLLKGDGVDSGNGKLQLATHTTSAGGIGFGTDTALFRLASGHLSVDSTGNNPSLKLSISGTAYGWMEYYSPDNAVYLNSGTGKSLVLRTNNGTTALTLDASQNATFAGKVTVSKANAGLDTSVTVNNTDSAANSTSSLILTSVAGSWTIQNNRSGGHLYFKDPATSATQLQINNSTGLATFAGSIAIGNTVQTAVAVASTHKVTIVIGGVTYYLLATNV